MSEIINHLEASNTVAKQEPYMYGTSLNFSQNIDNTLNTYPTIINMNDNKPITPDELVHLAKNACVLEAEMLANVIESGQLNTLLPHFSDYKRYIEYIRASIDYRKYCINNIIDISLINKDLERVFSSAHLAACCYLFSGLDIRFNDLNRGYLHNYAATYADKLIAEGKQGVRLLVHKLHNTDAIRTIHILKLFGLLSLDSQTCRQLSLGAGHGSRDLQSIHQVPVIVDRYEGNLISISPGTRCLSIESHTEQSNDTILVDNDPGYKEHYSRLNKQGDNKITALNMDLDSALQHLPGIMHDNNNGMRNLVIAFRIDHRMVPDVRHLLTLLYPVIEDKCDFVLSIGAGFTNKEFKGRLDKINEISTVLTNLGLDPVRIKLYSGSSLDEIRANRAFGTLNFATYEILYCKLNRRILRGL